MPRWPKMSPLTPEQSELVADNYPLVLYAVRKLWRSNLSVSLLGTEAIGEGYLALVKAARTFKPEWISPKTGKRVKFNTYALRAIYSNVKVAAKRWGRKTFVPDMGLLYRQLRARTRTNKVEADREHEGTNPQANTH